MREVHASYMRWLVILIRGLSMYPNVKRGRMSGEKSTKNGQVTIDAKLKL